MTGGGGGGRRGPRFSHRDYLKILTNSRLTGSNEEMSQRVQLPSYGMLQKTGHVDERPEIVFFEQNNPRALINLLPPELGRRAKSIPTHLLTCPIETFNDPEIKLTNIVRQLRIAFWDEYYISCDNNKKMRANMIFGRVCSKEQFYAYVTKDEYLLAYILRPPEDYQYKMRSLLDQGLERFAEILNLPIKTKKIVKSRTKNEDGEFEEIVVDVVDTKILSEIVKVVMMLDQRVRGSVVQKLEVSSKSLNVNVDAVAPKSHDEIGEELVQIENEIRALEGKTPVTEFLGDSGQEGIVEIEATTASVNKEEERD